MMCKMMKELPVDSSPFKDAILLTPVLLRFKINVEKQLIEYPPIGNYKMAQKK
jgi:hypothetical protein